MTFEKYVERQRQIIRDGHIGEESFIIGDEEIFYKSSEQFLQELEELKGLNKKERQGKSFPSRKAMRV